MRQILTAVAAIAVSGLIATTAARAEPAFEAGGPIKVGSWCSVSTSDIDNGNFGYMKPCAPTQQAKAAKPRKRKAS